MSRELQNAVLDVIVKVTKGSIDREAVLPWLKRPGRIECGEYWVHVRKIYYELTGLELNDVMPAKEWRRVDGVLADVAIGPRIVEIDEPQHFNYYRNSTFRYYPEALKVAFDRSVWIERSQCAPKQKTGGWAAPRPPLFPGEGGRHRQRAFRDALTDLLPEKYGYQPTLRVAFFEVESWIGCNDAHIKMKDLIENKLLIGE